MTLARALVVPAAGRGTRLGSLLPKLLVPVNGRAMIDHVLARHAPFVQHAVVIVSPDALALVERHTFAADPPVTVLVQQEPTGMLDAILIAREAITRLDVARVWITWCDQVALSPATVQAMADLEQRAQDAALVMPTCWRPAPYIHFERDASGRILAVRHRREGDSLPDLGENDLGVFSLSRRAFANDLAEFAGAVAPGAGTRERNFLPFIPWVDARGAVRTFLCEDPVETIGVNTPEELRALERHLAGIGSS